SLRFKPTDACVITMTLKPQKRSQTKIDVVTPCATATNLRTFNQTELLDAAMVVLNRPREACPFDSFQISHLKLVGRPPFNRAVCGNYLEYTDQTIAFEPDDSTALINLDTADGTQSSAVRIDFAVTLQTGQPNPLK